MISNRPKFNSDNDVFFADDCTPLRKAESLGTLSMKALIHGHYPGEQLPKLVLPGLLSVGYWNAEQQQDWGLDWHRNEGLELSFLKSGSLDFMTVSFSKKLVPNDLAISSPWQLHRLGDPTIDVGTLQWLILDQKIRSANQKWSWPNWIILTKNDLDELTQQLLYNRNSVCPANSKMVQCWDSLYKAVRYNVGVSHISQIAVTINEILLLLLSYFREATNAKDLHQPSVTPSHRAVQIFLEEIKSIPSQLEYQWSIKEMAKLCRMSESRFTQCCKKLTNLSPANYLNACRIDFAIQILRDNPESHIGEVAQRCGFSSSQYFATVFKKITGSSPSCFVP